MYEGCVCGSTENGRKELRSRSMYVNERALQLQLVVRWTDRTKDGHKNKTNRSRSNDHRWAKRRHKSGKTGRCKKKQAARRRGADADHGGVVRLSPVYRGELDGEAKCAGEGGTRTTPDPAADVRRSSGRVPSAASLVPRMRSGTCALRGAKLTMMPEPSSFCSNTGSGRGDGLRCDE